MPREESPARMRTRNRTPIPLAHMPRERHYVHPLGLTDMYARHRRRWPDQQSTSQLTDLLESSHHR
eukprot:4320229-Amphidinium_carterae.1